MCEKNKMLSGVLYNPAATELSEDRKHAKKVCKEFNETLNPELIRKLFGKTGEKFEINPHFWCDYGYNIEIGENFYSNHNLVILDCAKVVFGNNVFIGPNCGFYTAEHPADFETRISGLEYAREINIGNNVWFGGGVTVLSGVTIGENTVIGAGSVVTKEIPSNVIASGNPCRIIKQL